METTTAIRQLERVDYKGWTFRFRALPWSGSVAVDYEFWADNSTPRYRDPRDRVVAEGTFTLPVDEISTPAGLHRMFLDAIHAGPELHETREFYKVDGEAPFHPHTDNGNRLFTLTDRVAA